MTKISTNGLIMKIAIPIITIAFIAYGFYVLTDYRLDAVELETPKLDKKGCEPALENKLDIALMQMSMTTIQADQAEIKDEQKAMRKEFQVGLQEILRRLPPTD